MFTTWSCRDCGSSAAPTPTQSDNGNPHSHVEVDLDVPSVLGLDFVGEPHPGCLWHLGVGFGLACACGYRKYMMEGNEISQSTDGFVQLLRRYLVCTFHTYSYTIKPVQVMFCSTAPRVYIYMCVCIHTWKYHTWYIRNYIFYLQ